MRNQGDASQAYREACAVCPNAVTRGTDNSCFIDMATANQTVDILAFNDCEWLRQPYLESTYATRNTSVMESTINKDYTLTLPGHFEVVTVVVEPIIADLIKWEHSKYNCYALRVIKC